MSLPGLPACRTQCLAHDIRGARVPRPGPFGLNLRFGCPWCLRCPGTGHRRNLGDVCRLAGGVLHPGAVFGGRSRTAASGNGLPESRARGVTGASPGR